MKAIKYLLLFILTLSASTSFALTIKMGVLAPEKTTWANQLNKISEEVKKATENRVDFKIYYGGVQGDENNVLSKIRIGQLHGGIFTGKTLGEINGNIRLMEVPFTFDFKNDSKWAWATFNKMKNTFDKGLKDNGFTNLGFIEVGPVYLVLTKPAKSFEELKGVKIWIWSGDKLAEMMVKTMNFTAVPLALQDVLPSLSTGILEATYAPPMAIFAVQWHKKTKYLVDYPITFSVGSFLVANKMWDKVSDADKKTISEIIEKNLAIANKKTIEENKETLMSMQTIYGFDFLKFPEKDIAQTGDIRNKVISKLTGKGDGKLFDPEVAKTFEKIRNETKQ